MLRSLLTGALVEQREVARMAVVRACAAIADIESALEPFDHGTYGTCESCRRAVPFEYAAQRDCDRRSAHHTGRSVGPCYRAVGPRRAPECMHVAQLHGRRGGPGAFADGATLDDDQLMAIERASLAISMRPAQASVVAEAEARFAALSLEELIAGHPGSAEAVAERAISFGWDLRRPRAVLLASAPPQERADFVQHAIGPLVEHDRSHRSDLVETSEMWLRTGNMAEAARRIYVHYNTFKNRPERTESILGPVVKFE